MVKGFGKEAHGHVLLAGEVRADLQRAEWGEAVTGKQKPFDNKAYMKAYHQRPEYKAYQKAYRQRPEYKAKQKAWNKAYQQRPEVKAKQKAYCQRRGFCVSTRILLKELAAYKKAIAESKKRGGSGKLTQFHKIRMEAIEDVCRKAGVIPEEVKP